MNTWKSLPMLAAAGLFAASVASAQEVTCGDDSATRSDTRAHAPVEGPLLEGEVAAVDHESGQLVLSTESGIFSLLADPEDIQDVAIGDRIQVALIEDE